MTTNEERRGPLTFRTSVTADGVRLKGLADVVLDPAEARRLAEALTEAATESDVLASQLTHVAGCTAHVRPPAPWTVSVECVRGGVFVLRATRPGGQGRWLTEGHALDGACFDSRAEALQAATDAGLLP